MIDYQRITSYSYVCTTRPTRTLLQPILQHLSMLYTNLALCCKKFEIANMAFYDCIVLVTLYIH